MNENNVLVDGMADILRQLPASFQKFMSICKDAEEKVMIRPKKNPCLPEQQETDVESGLEDLEFDCIKNKIKELELQMMNNIEAGNSSSKELAGILGVSVETIKRRYKELVTYGLIKTTRSCGVSLTIKGLKFLCRLKETVDKVSIVSKLADTYDTNATYDTY
jgi:DNA-binding transcriptional regulator YhcF (GntR family)